MGGVTGAAAVAARTGLLRGRREELAVVDRRSFWRGHLVGIAVREHFGGEARLLIIPIGAILAAAVVAVAVAVVMTTMAAMAATVAAAATAAVVAVAVAKAKAARWPPRGRLLASIRVHSCG